VEAALKPGLGTKHVCVGGVAPGQVTARGIRQASQVTRIVFLTASAEDRDLIRHAGFLLECSLKTKNKLRTPRFGRLTPIYLTTFNGGN